MKKPGNILISFVISIAIFASIFGSGFFVGKNSNQVEAQPVVPQANDFELPAVEEKRIVTINEINTKLEKTQEFATCSGEYSVDRTEVESRYLSKLALLGTKNSITINCSGIVKVGYDVDDIKIDVDNESQTIYIVLPSVSVLDNYIIWDSVNCNEDNNWFNPINFQQYKTMITELESQGLQDAEEKGIYQKAEEHMETIVTTFLSSIEDYEVKFM